MPSTNYMPTRPLAPNRPAELCSRMHRRTQRAFTLVEVMIATMVFCMGILGVYAMMIKSYELVTMARHRDNARAYLQSFSDQFMRLQTNDKNSVPLQPPITRPLFDTTAVGSAGLTWIDSAGVTHVPCFDSDPTALNYLHPNPAASSLRMLLGDTATGANVGNTVVAHVSREVTYLDDHGLPTNTYPAAAAGFMIQGKFTITYSISGRIQTQVLTVARAVTQ